MEALAIPIVGALGVGHIVARYADAPRVAGVLKPLPIAVLAVMVWQGPPLDARYSTLVVAGLVCSMVGDVCLLFPGRFVVGLASFLVAHLFYIAAFAAGAHRGTRGVTFLAPFLALAAVLIGALWRRVKELAGSRARRRAPHARAERHARAGGGAPLHDVRCPARLRPLHPALPGRRRRRHGDLLHRASVDRPLDDGLGHDDIFLRRCRLRRCHSVGLEELAAKPDRFEPGDHSR